MSGERLHIQWWCDPTGQWFAAQVMDCANAGVWEVFLVPGRTGAPFAGKRLCMGSTSSLEVLDTVWLEAFAGATTGLVSAGPLSSLCRAGGRWQQPVWGQRGARRHRTGTSAAGRCAVLAAPGQIAEQDLRDERGYLCPANPSKHPARAPSSSPEHQGMAS